MKTRLKKFQKDPVFVQLIGILSVIGVISNMGLICKDLLHHSILWQLHGSFLLLYIGQVVFILLREKYVCVFTIFQGLAALLTAADFTFTPILQFIGLLYWFTNPTLEAQSNYQYIFISAAFTLQLASAAYLWFYFKKEKIRPLQ